MRTQAALAVAPDLTALRRRLAVLLAGIEDLRQEWASTAELALQLHRQRATAGQSTSTADVLLDLEAVMRASSPLPWRIPPVTSVTDLRLRISDAEAGYDRLIRHHLAHAAEILDHQ